MTSSAIVSEVVKHLEVLPLNLQTQVLNFVRKLSSAGSRAKRETNEISAVSEVVARIKSVPPNTAMITQPQGSLANALRNAQPNSSFDLEQWEQEWAAAEEELKRINLEDDISEGRI